MNKLRVTTTLGDLREALKDLPDDTTLFVDDGMMDYYEIRVNHVLPPVMDNPPAVILEMGQVFNLEYDLTLRVDVAIGYDPEEK